MLCNACAWPVRVTRPDRSLDKPATTIGAHVVQRIVDTIGAERTLVGTNARIRRIEWQILIAIFAVRPKFEH
jgi:hypothetical protein